jgi:hypothetical protein
MSAKIATARFKCSDALVRASVGPEEIARVVRHARGPVGVAAEFGRRT